MNAQDWRDMASVYEAGAKCARTWTYNRDRQQEAEVLDAMAGRCREIADRRDRP
jgi:hypothetical protein